MKLIKKYSCYEYEIRKYGLYEKCDDHEHQLHGQAYDYKIKTEGCYPYDDRIINSEEWFETEEEADQAAKEHIDRLENDDN
jgi:hypothetical protein